MVWLKRKKKNTKKTSASAASVHSIDPEKVGKKPTQTQWIRQKKREKIKSYRNESNYIALYNTHSLAQIAEHQNQNQTQTHTQCAVPINVQKKLYWPNLNLSDSVKNYFVHIAIGEQSIFPKTHHSAHCFGMHPCARWKKSIRMIGLVSFPNLPAAHITSLLFITASWKKQRHAMYTTARAEKNRDTTESIEHTVLVLVCCSLFVSIGVLCYCNCNCNCRKQQRKRLMESQFWISP